MGSNEAVELFLKRGSWRVTRSIDLGTTARILVVERHGERYALKAARDQGTGGLLTEYRVLRHLNRSAMRPHVPRVEAWLPDVGGFLMAHLRYPTPAEKGDAAWLPNLARALRALHAVDLSALPELDDDRPQVTGAVVGRFRELFDLVWRGDGFWAGLAQEDGRKLEHVRAHHRAFTGLLPEVEQVLAAAPAALTHGDLAGDNVMVEPGGLPAIVDWGSARISAAWLDVASLAMYSAWPPDERRRFYALYLGDNMASDAHARRCLEILCHLYRYRSCVQSLLWLNGEGEGLDPVGRAFFERQLRALSREGV